MVLLFLSRLLELQEKLLELLADVTFDYLYVNKTDDARPPRSRSLLLRLRRLKLIVKIMVDEKLASVTSVCLCLRLHSCGYMGTSVSELINLSENTLLRVTTIRCKL